MANQRADELKQIIIATREELHEIEATEARKKNAALIGKCFKYHNCYSCPQNESDYWWAYLAVTGLSDNYLSVWQFEIDEFGKATVEKSDAWTWTDGWKSISKNEFNASWQKFLKYVTSIPSSKKAKHRAK